MKFQLLVILLLVSVGFAQNASQAIKSVPPPGIEISATDRSELENGVNELGKEIDSLRVELKDKPKLLELLPDVQVFYNAVHYALKYNEFLNAKEIPVAKNQIKQGIERAKELRAGKPSWISQTGLVVRGYISKIDGSVQPYGLVVPVSYQTNLPFQYRLDVWYHGRSETLTEINFINDRQKNPGQFTPANTFVLHPYGRLCNANKFAGEVDTFEALEQVRKHYPIDENRISVRGFSMGGAATWHLAAHHAGLWAAAAPGAGFVESAEYLKLNLKDVPWYEQKLWRWTDAASYAGNLFNLPVVAYSGEIDKQKQAADVMAREMKKEGLELTHIIGPNTEHKYHPDSIPEINRRLDSIIAKGRNPIPAHVKFTTYTLRYNKMLWVTVDHLDQHWEQATIDAEIIGDSMVRVKTKNISAFTIEMPAGLCPLNLSRIPTVFINGLKAPSTPIKSDRSWIVHYGKYGVAWNLIEAPERTPVITPQFIFSAISPNPPAAGSNTPTIGIGIGTNGTPTFIFGGAPLRFRKSHGLQGPIDDAFMDRFVMVRPTGTPLRANIGAWVKGEMDYAIKIWRSQFRGEALVKNDSEITPDDIANSNLILWGDPSSNEILFKIVDRLPIKWMADNIQVGAQTYSSTNHLPILIFPNPLNPKRYVVLNSGFTFREDNASNARQTPKLPDWAIVDITVPPTPLRVGKVVNAGFFGEWWELK